MTTIELETSLTVSASCESYRSFQLFATYEFLAVGGAGGPLTPEAVDGQIAT